MNTITVTQFDDRDVETARALLARCRTKLSGAEITLCERIAEGIAVEDEHDRNDPVDLMKLATEFAREISLHAAA